MSAQEVSSLPLPSRSHYSRLPCTSESAKNEKLEVSDWAAHGTSEDQDSEDETEESTEEESDN